jgi:predicted DNA-binding transcriptional regulator AlpA
MFQGVQHYPHPPPTSILSLRMVPSTVLPLPIQTRLNDLPSRVRIGVWDSVRWILASIGAYMDDVLSAVLPIMPLITRNAMGAFLLNVKPIKQSFRVDQTSRSRIWRILSWGTRWTHSLTVLIN